MAAVIPELLGANVGGDGPDQCLQFSVLGWRESKIRVLTGVPPLHLCRVLVQDLLIVSLLLLLQQLLELLQATQWQ